MLGVVDSDGARAESAARAFGAAHSGTSLDEAWLAGVSCVTVGTPPMPPAAGTEAIGSCDTPK